MSTSSHRWQRVEAVFHEVADLPQGEQTQAVLRLCADDAWIAGQVLGMVRADRSPLANSLAQIQASAATLRQDVQSQTRIARQPTHIGPYVIKQLLGQGGFGTVYLGEQSQPVQRLVAIKVVRIASHAQTERVLQRFIMERRTLALLDHPAIARLIDAGETDEGEPYFSMEYIEGGQPITRFCDAQRLTIPQRLRLLVTVCRAIHHAHQRAIVHRDIKPSNVLIGQVSSAGEALVKVIDFGIAKVLATDSFGVEPPGGAHSRALLTSIEHVIGTPEYMSPEQARTGGHNVDTRSDIFALGLLAHELLAGCLPHDAQALRALGPIGACLQVAKGECPPMTARIRQLAPGEQREQAALRGHASPDALLRTLRGDLASIVARATAHDPQHRYASADALADDVERYLALRPVQARRAGALYRAAKFMRRNRARITVGTLGVLLVGATVFGLVARNRAATLASTQALREQTLAYDAMIDAHASAVLAMEQGQFAQARQELDRTPRHLRGWEWRVLHNRLREMRPLFRANAYFHQVAAHPTRNVIAVSTTGGGLFLLDRDAPSDQPPRYVRPAAAHGYGRSGVAFSPDGSTLAFSSNDQLWLLPLDAIDQTKQGTIASDGASLPSFVPLVAPARWIDPAWVEGARAVPVPPRAARLHWSRDGAHIALVSERRIPFSVAVVGVASGRLVAQDLGPCHLAAVIHPTLPHVIWGDRDGQVFAYDWQARQIVHTSNTTHEAIADIVLSPDGTSIAIASSREVRLLASADYALQDRLRAPAIVTSVCWSRDGAWIFGANLGTAYPTWSARSGLFAGLLPCNVVGAENVTVSPVTGELIVPQTSGQVSAVHAQPDLLDLGPGRGGAAPLASGPLLALRTADFVPSSPTLPLAIGSIIDFYDPLTYEFEGSLRTPSDQGWSIWTFPHPDASVLVWQLDGPCLQLRNITTGALLREHPVPPNTRIVSIDVREAFALLTPEGWQLRDTRTGLVRHEVTAAQIPGLASVQAMWHSADARLMQCREVVAATDIASAQVRFTIRHAQTGALVSVLDAPSTLDVGRFLFDNTLLVAGGDGLNVFDVATGTRVRTIDVDRTHAWLQALPDESRVLSVGHDHTIAVYDTITWRRTAQFRFEGIPAQLRDGTLATMDTDRFLRFLRP